MKRTELLAPAGTLESFYGALNAGADAIYLAGTKFGARAYAQNFTQEELLSAIKLAHLLGRKVYMTVNTLLKNAETDELYDYMKPFYEEGLDGVIVQDFGVVAYFKKYFPELEIHGSTQMTITGVKGAKYLSQQGLTRIVPSRELSLQEIQAIKQELDIEVECFIHGAMCYSYSGQCLFSSVLGGRSGNRGSCAGPCRLPYRFSNTTSDVLQYPISMKDQVTIEILDRLMEAGIDSFKIEGRMKKPEYAAGVTAIYRKVMDAYYRDKKLHVSKEDLALLEKLYLRSERQTGYYEKQNGREMISLDSPAYNPVDEALLQSIRDTYIHKPHIKGLSFSGYFGIGTESYLVASLGDISVCATGMQGQEATGHPVDRETIEKQLSKLGDTPFLLDSIQIEVEDHLFYPLKAINELRREAVLLLEQELLKANGYEKRTATPKEEDSYLVTLQNAKLPRKYAILLTTKEQLAYYLSRNREGDCELYLESTLYQTLSKEELEATGPFCIALPYIVRSRSYRYLDTIYDKGSLDDNVKGFLVRNLETFQWLKEKKTDKKCILDAGMYSFNRYAAAFWESEADRITLPYELSGKEQRELVASFDSEKPIEKILYGRIPLMVTANCIAKTEHGTCRKTNGKDLLSLTDRMNIRFPVLRDCENCYNILYNSVPTAIWNKRYHYSDRVIFRLQFTTENANQMEQVLRFYENLEEQKPDFDFTTGYENKTVE